MNFSIIEIEEVVPKQVPMDSTLWPFKHDAEQLKVIETGDPYTYASQMIQKPYSYWWRYVQRCLRGDIMKFYHLI